jgi:hypothetical protein
MADDQRAAGEARLTGAAPRSRRLRRRRPGRQAPAVANWMMSALGQLSLAETVALAAIIATALAFLWRKAS